ncbi:hypothetical protein ACK4QV_19905, partial [Proteus mirabilis]
MRSTNKNTILFISPKFFGYENEILKELELTNNVIYWDERPSNNSIYKSLLRLRCSIIIKNYNINY